LDEALALPSEGAARIALRTQQIIAYESGVTNTVDPLGGSYFLESLTDHLEAQATAYIDQVDQMGGALRALEAGYFQREVAESAYRYQRQVEAGDAVIVGVNRFASTEESPVELLRVDPAVADAQVARLTALKQRRDSRAVAASLAILAAAARGTDNLVEVMVGCVENYCTLGEISDTLRSVFGIHHELVEL